MVHYKHHAHTRKSLCLRNELELPIIFPDIDRPSSSTDEYYSCTSRPSTVVLLGTRYRVVLWPTEICHTCRQVTVLNNRYELCGYRLVGVCNHIDPQRIFKRKHFGRRIDGVLEHPRRGTFWVTSSRDPCAVGAKGGRGTMVTRT